jgi:hypothetical protein
VRAGIGFNFRPTLSVGARGFTAHYRLERQ